MIPCCAIPIDSLLLEESCSTELGWNRILLSVLYYKVYTNKSFHEKSSSYCSKLFTKQNDLQYKCQWLLSGPWQTASSRLNKITIKFAHWVVGKCYCCSSIPFSKESPFWYPVQHTQKVVGTFVQLCKSPHISVYVITLVNSLSNIFVFALHCSFTIQCTSSL